jgi:hypothetical protein
MIVVLMVMLLSPSVVMAQGMYPGMKPSKDQAEAFKTGIEMMLLYKFLGQPSMVASGDDIFVLFGNKITKYDKDLNQVKEVTLGIDLTSTREMVSKIAGTYSEELMQKMMSATAPGPGTAAMPMQGSMSANEALAKATLRTLSTAAESYASANAGSYPASILDLTGATPPYLNTNYCEQPVSGYSYDCLFTTTEYKIAAIPGEGEAGTTFTITTGGVLQP